MKIEIVTFYKFIPQSNLEEKKIALKQAMATHSIYGTIILAEEGFNSTVCGGVENIKLFIADIERILGTKIEFKSSFHNEITFKRQKVRVKKEIVTLRKSVDVTKGEGTHISPKRWNSVLNDPNVVVLDSRNDYEYRVGSFHNAVNPKIASFVDLPEYVEKNLDPKTDKKIAMYCTGGIRCEKFVPYLKEIGFKEVYQLEGGILKYLEEIDPSESLWNGECFVFDERITVDAHLKQGSAIDLSLEVKNGKE